MEVVKQDGTMDCGISCLLSVIKHYGGNVPLEELREKTKTNKEGVSAYKLVETAKDLGFMSYGVSAPLDELHSKDLPIISHVIINKSFMHFVVLYEINKDKKQVVIMDPSKGKKTLSFAEYNLLASNKYVYLKPLKELPNIKEKKFIHKWLKAFTKTNLSYILYIVLFSLSFFVFNVICGLHFSLLLNNAISQNIKKNLFSITYCITLIYILKSLTTYLRNKTLAHFSYLLDEFLTKKFYNKLLLLPYMYYKNRTTGEIINRMEDLENIKQFLTNFLSSVFTDFLVGSIFLFVIYSCTKKVFILLCIYLFLIIFLNTINNIIYRKKLERYHREQDNVNSMFIEHLETIATIKNLHLEASSINKFQTNYKSLLASSYEIFHNHNCYTFLKQLFHDLFYIIFFLIVGLDTIDQKLSLSMIFILQSILSYFLQSFNNIISVYNSYIPYKISKKRVEDLFMIRGDNFCCETLFDKKILNGTIKYHNLTLTVDDHILFDKLDFTINKKDKIFFYGNSGSGKTTLMKILLLYIEVPPGTVYINNIDINHHHIGLIRNKIAYVSQAENIFKDTLENNITLGKEINDKDLEKIIKITRLENFVVNKTLKLKTPIAEGNYNISGGEKQRIVLARTLLKNSDIYIFDEAFSQIDEQTEQLILTDMFKYLKDKTIIVISHRMSNRNLYNRIVRLDKGKIYEELSK